MHFLESILANKRARLKIAQESKPLLELESEARVCRRAARPNSLSDALENVSFPGIIAEFKRQSPSRGMIRGAADPVVLARMYQAGGAAAISVLTEEDSFQGSLQDLLSVRGAVSLPLLRKDFVLDPYQVFETAASGADALLLIVAILDEPLLNRLYQLIEELGMDALVEVHTKREMERAIAMGAKLIGVNNRDLSSFTVSLETSLTLAQMASGKELLVSESGINSMEQMEQLRGAGYDGFLIGESLMRATDPDTLLRSWTSRS